MLVWYHDLYLNKPDNRAAIYKVGDTEPILKGSVSSDMNFTINYEWEDGGSEISKGIIDLMNRGKTYLRIKQDNITSLKNFSPLVSNLIDGLISNIADKVNDLTGEKYKKFVNNIESMFKNSKSSRLLNSQIVNKEELMKRFSGLSVNVSLPQFVKYYVYDSSDSDPLKRQVIDDLCKTGKNLLSIESSFMEAVDESLNISKNETDSEKLETRNNLYGLLNNIVSPEKVVIYEAPHGYQYDFSATEDTLQNTLVLVTSLYVLRPLLVSNISVQYSTTSCTVQEVPEGSIEPEGAVPGSNTQAIVTTNAAYDDLINKNVDKARSVQVTNMSGQTISTTDIRPVYEPSWIKLTIDFEWAIKPTTSSVKRMMEQTSYSGLIQNYDTLFDYYLTKLKKDAETEQKERKEELIQMESINSFNDKIDKKLAQLEDTMTNNLVFRTLSDYAEKSKKYSNMVKSYVKTGMETVSKLTKAVNIISSGLNKGLSSITSITHDVSSTLGYISASTTETLNGLTDAVTGTIDNIRGSIARVATDINDAKKSIKSTYGTIMNYPASLSSSVSESISDLGSSWNSLVGTLKSGRTTDRTYSGVSRVMTDTNPRTYMLGDTPNVESNEIIQRMQGNPNNMEFKEVDNIEASRSAIKISGDVNKLSRQLQGISGL